MSNYRRLYNFYSPIKSNNTLLSHYYNTTNDHDNVSDIREHINTLIYHNYINEAIVKSAFTKEYLIKRSPRLNTSIFELNVGSSRADIVTINGSSHVYEVKTAYDSFERLSSQINDYMNHFEYINVIVPKNDIKSLLKLLDDNIGIIFYYKNRLGNIKFKFYRKPKINNNINPIEQLNSLTKNELLALINERNNYSLSKDFIINKLLDTFTKSEINDIFKEQVKNKFYDKWNFLFDNIEDIYILDYQWFFKNNISTHKVYR